MEKVWGTVTEWQQLYNGWKDGRFGDLKVEEMEEAAGRIAKSLQRLGREIKHWPVWAWIKVTSSSLPLPNPDLCFVRSLPRPHIDAHSVALFGFLVCSLSVE